MSHVRCGGQTTLQSKAMHIRKPLAVGMIVMVVMMVVFQIAYDLSLTSSTQHPLIFKGLPSIQQLQEQATLIPERYHILWHPFQVYVHLLIGVTLSEIFSQYRVTARIISVLQLVMD